MFITRTATRGGVCFFFVVIFILKKNYFRATATAIESTCNFDSVESQSKVDNQPNGRI